MSQRGVGHRFARAIVERLLHGDDREFLLGDLDDGYDTHPGPRLRATCWYLCQACHAAVTRRRRATLPDHFHRGARSLQMTGTLRTDIASSLRGFRKHPGAFGIIVLSLALGIGAASAMFTIVRGVLLTPLPYGEPERVVSVWSRWQGYDKTWVSGQEVLDYRERGRALADVAAWSTTRRTLTGVGDATRVGAAFVTPNTFTVLGAHPTLGRTFSDEEARTATPSEPLLVVISHGLWTRLFGAEADVASRSLDVNGRAARVLGVMPAGFRLPTDFGEGAAEPTELWMPMTIDPATASRGSHGLYAVARLAPGATADQANDDLARITADLNAEGLYPPSMQFTAIAVPVADDVLGAVRPTLRVLFGAVMFLLLIACGNAAALLLARAEARQREFATRTALGANRWRLVRQQLVEGSLLALASGLAGLGLASLAGSALQAFGPTAIPRAGDVSIDWTVVAFMAAISGLAAVLCTLPPAFRAFHVSLVDGLRDGNTQASAGRARMRLRSGLVIAQLGLATVLLVGAGVTLRSLWTLQSVDLGLDPTGVFTAQVSIPAPTYDTPEKVDAFFTSVLDDVRALPDVESAGLLMRLPLAGPFGDWSLRVDGYTPPPGDSAKGDWQVVTDGALEALRVTLLRGRLFDRTDTMTSQPVMLINETMAAMYWPDRDPLGHVVRVGGSGVVVTVAGVVNDLRNNGVTAPIKGQFYLPYSQFSNTGNSPALTFGTIAARTTGSPTALAVPVRDIVRRHDSQVPVVAVQTMGDVLDTALTAPRLTSSVLLTFAAVAAVLSAVGIYGLLVFMVAQRSYEIGIRVAVGAEAGQIIRLVVRRGLVLAIVGVGLGTLAAAAATRVLAGQLHEVSPLDMQTFFAVPVLLLAVSLAASLLPAWRATRVDPLRALRG